MTGQIRILPTKKQREAKRVLDKNTILVYGGGIRSGKSFFLLLTILTYCFKYNKSRWLILRQSMPTLKRNLFPSFQELLDMGFQQYVREWNQSTHTVTFSNGSQILFMAESFNEDKELNRFRGLEINGAGIDEINEIQEKTFYKIIERSGSWTRAGRVPIKIIGTCNPSQGWVKEKFYDRAGMNQLPEGWAFMSALITDNPYISPEYLDSLEKNMPEWEYEVFVKGNWDMKLEGVLFAKSDLKTYTPPLNAEGCAGVMGYIDVADEGDDYLAAVFAKVYENKIFITDVIFTRDNIDITLPLVAGKIKELNADYIRVESNNQGSAFIKMLRNHVPPEKVLKVTNSSNKHTRILMEYGFIKENIYFKDKYEQGGEYDLFMRQILSYMKDGSSKHDDAIDALSGLSRFIRSFLSHLWAATAEK